MAADAEVTCLLRVYPVGALLVSRPVQPNGSFDADRCPDPYSSSMLPSTNNSIPVMWLL